MGSVSKEKTAMKTKLVLRGERGTEETPEKVLLALELLPETNKVQTWIFDGELATEIFEKALMDQWRKGEAVVFPASVTPTEKTLSASESLIPEDIRTEKMELLTRTQTEWIFIVLSTKLYKTYQNELNELEEQINNLKAYSKAKWEAMKNFWAKVQTQINEQNLFRDHTNTLRNRTNELFAELKQMRAQEDAKFETEAKSSYENIQQSLNVIEEKIGAEGSDLQKLFNELKQLQNTFKNAKLTRSLRSKLWEQIDAAFKLVKQKRSPNSSPEGRLTRRIEGLEGAIAKMEKSIERDNKELFFQNKKIASGDVSQLETQLREVRAKLIKERIDSKEKKLEDMKKTMNDLQTRQAKNQARKEKELAAAEAKAAAAKAKSAVEEAAKEAAQKAAEQASEVAPVAEIAEKEEAAATEKKATPEVVSTETKVVEVVDSEDAKEEEE